MKKIVLIPLASLALGFASLSQANATECYTVAACVLGANFGPGPGGAGVEGQAQNAIGLLGVSNNYVGTYGRSTNYFGVVGVTQSLGAGIAGVYGTTQSPSYNSIGVFGNSSTGKGVVGLSGSGIGDTGEAVSGGVGVYGTTTNGGVAGSFFAQKTGDAVDAETNGGTAFNGSASSGTAEQLSVSSSSQSLFVGSVSLSSGSSAQVVSIDGVGNETLAGILTQEGTPQMRTRAASGDVTTYGARSASPTLEDTGTAKLANGSAFVALDATFASTIAPGYEVFVTPHGDSNGLYTQASASGFSVRENKGGHSTFTFDYRIVAKPLDARGTRLAAMVPAKRLPFAKPVMPRVTLPRALPR